MGGKKTLSMDPSGVPQAYFDWAAQHGCCACDFLNIQDLQIFGDSKVIIDHVRSIYVIKNFNLLGCVEHDRINKEFQKGLFYRLY